MEYYQCKCGHTTRWASLPMPACAGCNECGTRLGHGGGSAGSRAPHTPFTRAQYEDGKVVIRTWCRLCDVRLPNPAED